MPSTPTVTRRRVVSGVLAVVFGSAVVESVQSSEFESMFHGLFPSAGIGRLVVTNHDDATHEFRTVVEVAGEPRYEETHAVAGGSSVRVVDELPSERGRVSVRTRVTGLENGPATGSRTFSTDACYGVGVNYSRRYGVWFTSGAPVDTCG